jgi:hypothetical protein
MPSIEGAMLSVGCRQRPCRPAGRDPRTGSVQQIAVSSPVDGSRPKALFGCNKLFCQRARETNRRLSHARRKRQAALVPKSPFYEQRIAAIARSGSDVREPAGGMEREAASLSRGRASMVLLARPGRGDGRMLAPRHFWPLIRRRRACKAGAGKPDGAVVLVG